MGSKTAKTDKALQLLKTVRQNTLESLESINRALAALTEERKTSLKEDAKRNTKRTAKGFDRLFGAIHRQRKHFRPEDNETIYLSFFPEQLSAREKGLHR